MKMPALIIAHPGHELRLHHWLERARPLVFVLTDGSGSAGQSRVPSTVAVLDTAGGRASSIMGAFTDAEFYSAIMTGDIETIAQVINRIAEALVEHHVDLVVADACEFYNPGHDLCRVIANLAVARAEELTGREIAAFEYAVVGIPDADGSDGEEVLRLDDAALQRKYDAAMHYPEMRHDLEIALKLDRLDAFRVEALRPVAKDGLPEPDGRPFYERAGEEHVAAGRYERVLRYDEHFAPFVRELTASMRLSPVPS